MAAPYLQNLSPASGTVITAGQPVVFEVLSDLPLVRVIVAFGFPGYNVTDVAYDGALKPAYAAGAVEAITDGGDAGFRFTLRRAPAWPDSPQLTVYAFNDAGEEL